MHDGEGALTTEGSDGGACGEEHLAHTRSQGIAIGQGTWTGSLLTVRVPSALCDVYDG
jgi:hypothetical protein